MLASVELPQDFKLLNRQFQGLVQALLDEIEVPSVRVEVAPTQSGNFRGFDGSRFYIVESGTVTVRYANRSVYLLEEGDLLLPDAVGTRDPDIAAYYGSEAGASLSAFNGLEFMAQVFARPHGDQALDTHSGDLLGHDAAPDAMQTQVDVVTTPGFAVYEPGESHHYPG
jgi:CRP/FNR family cyclic AMP-dependent transcriptional regulator